MEPKPEVAAPFSLRFLVSFVTFHLNRNVWAMQGKSLVHFKNRISRITKAIGMTLTSPPTHESNTDSLRRRSPTLSISATAETAAPPPMHFIRPNAFSPETANLRAGLIRELSVPPN